MDDDEFDQLGDTSNVPPLTWQPQTGPPAPMPADPQPVPTHRSVRARVRTPIEQQIHDRIHALERKWEVGEEGRYLREVEADQAAFYLYRVNVAKRCFGVGAIMSVGEVRSLADEISKQIYELQQLDEDMKRHKSEYSDGAVEVFGRRIENLIGVLVYSAETLRSSTAMCALSGRGVLASPPELEDFNYSPYRHPEDPDNVECKPFQMLLIYLQQKLSELRYRHLGGDGHGGGDCYEPIFAGNHFTHAYRKKCTVLQFISENTSRTRHAHWWKLLTSTERMTDSLANFLVGRSDSQFPLLKVNRRYFSFRNGIYFADRDKFIQYGAEYIPCGTVTCKFFDQDFQTFDLVDDWYDIPTPALQSILDYQGWDREVKRQVYVQLGRCIYNVNEHDGWSVAAFFKGVAGTGEFQVRVIF